MDARPMGAGCAAGLPKPRRSQPGGRLSSPGHRASHALARGRPSRRRPGEAVLVFNPAVLCGRCSALCGAVPLGLRRVAGVVREAATARPGRRAIRTRQDPCRGNCPAELGLSPGNPDTPAALAGLNGTELDFGVPLSIRLVFAIPLVTAVLVLPLAVTA